MEVLYDMRSKVLDPKRQQTLFGNRMVQNDQLAKPNVLETIRPPIYDLPRQSNKPGFGQ